MAKRRLRKTAPVKAATFTPTRLKENVDTYTDAIYAVLALVHHARWDPDARRVRSDVKFGVGRRFVTSKDNRLAPSQEITPDCAIQYPSGQAIIAEAKPGVARHKAVWEENLKQLVKYDDRLTGWWTPTETLEGQHDILVLVPQSRVVDFVDLMNEQIKAGVVSFERPVIAVHFVKNTGAEKTWVMLKTETGHVSEPTLRDQLRRSVAIDWEHLIVHYNDRKFIDVEPPLPYVLYVLWDCVFNKKATGRQPEPGESYIAVDVEVAALTREVQEFYGFRSDGPRAIEVPRQRWIRRALDALVTFGMAKRNGEGYRIKYKRHRTAGDTVTFFGRLEFKHADRLARAAERKPLLELATQPGPDGS